MDDENSQSDEINSLKTIYENDAEFFSFNSENLTGTFQIKITADTQPFSINLLDEKLEIRVFNLPPITLEYNLPRDYPSVNPPNYKLYCSWLSRHKLGLVCQHLDDLWKENSQLPILFTWVSFIQNEIFEFLNIDPQKLTIQTENSECCSSKYLINYDSQQQELHYLRTFFQCNVCFDEKQGKDCFKFINCSHVFCNECMTGYFKTLITDGDVKALKCPQDKCESQAIPSQVLKLVGPEVFTRYDNLLLQKALDSMSDLVYCPKVYCQSVVIPENEYLCQCPKCYNAFCAKCKLSYHGVDPCRIADDKLIELYLNSDDETKEMLIKKYGDRVKFLINEKTSTDEIESWAKKCPCCAAWIEKIEGCNKMLCSKCGKNFCWICRSFLSEKDPYAHFREKNNCSLH